MSSETPAKGVRWDEKGFGEGPYMSPQKPGHGLVLAFDDDREEKKI